MGQNNLYILLTTAFLFLMAMAETISAQPQRAYERGLEELYRNNVTRALDIWYQAYEDEGPVDSRVGIEFIKTVTERNLEDYFDQATELYYRAITNGSGMDSRVAIRREIDRMRPIIGEGIYRQWNEWWGDEDPQLAVDMRGFWIQADPTPSRQANERLIEHWQRIADAQENFRKNRNTVFNTDDRALIYIRYGEPDRTRNGILTLQTSNIRQWLQNQVNPYSRTEREEMSGQDEHERDFAENIQIDRLQDAIYQFHRYPEYEIWFYEGVSEGNSEPLIFIFGTDVESEEFRLQRGVESFIPERAYNPERERSGDSVEFTRAGITPALMLQLMYYEQLASADEYFQSRLNTLRNRILEQGRQAFRGLDTDFRAESADLLNSRLGVSPVTKSTYSEKIPEIPMEMYQYRFLNEDQEPVIMTFIESSAREAFMIDYYRNRGQYDVDESMLTNGKDISEIFNYYELTHTFKLYDDSWNTLQTESHNPPLILDRNENRSSSRTIIETHHTGRQYVTSSAELMNFNPDTRAVYETPFTPALRGLGKVQIRQPEPLVSHADSLEMADLILGYQKTGQFTEPFPFIVANERVVPFEETLVLHFEVYNIAPREDGFTHFELTYRILPVDEFGQVLTDQTEFVLTLNFVNEYRRVVEDLEIETAELSPGLYDLQVAVEDMVTGQQKNRSVRFEVAGEN
ncbi:GWxTD domain-containing protein [Rhodohalobacter halophilus]|uniref:GWxTD domain-containing protein n=1 Tax=Rhodohalobacter halophilus TaxID=1812810 RepID=UPI00083F787F|nr:GWxTD domain-containing protein [Rhodohalobacter halophilus]